MTPTLAERRFAEVLAAVVLAGLIVAILTVIAEGFDGRLASWAAMLPPDAKRWGSMMSRLGESGYLFASSAIVALGALYLRGRARSEPMRLALTCASERASYVFAVLCVTGAATQVIKHLIGRGRPPLFAEYGAFHLSPFSWGNAYASFPSGHASTSFAVATALTLLAPSLGVPLMSLAAAIAASRIVVGAHFASDIVGGGAFGVVCALLTARWFARYGIAFRLQGQRPALKTPGAVAAVLPA